VFSALLYGASCEVDYDDDETLTSNADDVTLVALPMSHQFGIVSTLCQSLTLGHQVVVMAQFCPTQYVRLVSKYNVC